MSFLFMLGGDFRLRKSDNDGHWRICEWYANRRRPREHLLLRKSYPRWRKTGNLHFSDLRTSWYHCYCGKHFDPNRPSQKHFASSTFQSIASESGCKWSQRWFRATCSWCFGDLHSARMVANVSPFTFSHWYNIQHFDNSIIVDHNRHKRRQTFGSVVKTQVQTSGHH